MTCIEFKAPRFLLSLALGSNANSDLFSPCELETL